MKIYGIDDGHSSIKIVSDNEKKRFDSRLLIGKKKSFNLISGEDKSYSYSINGNDYTISQENDISLDTRFEDYPTSDINIVLANHSLNLLKAKGNVSICTGLPFNRYYQNGEVNQKLIDKKKEVFKKNVIGLNNKINIINHNVCAEAIASYYDFLLLDNGKVNNKILNHINKDSVIVIDIGGRTTDIVTFNNHQINFEKSITLDLGCLDVEENLRKNISKKINCYDIPQSVIKKTIINNGVYESSKNIMDFNDVLTQSKIVLANTIINKIKAIVSNTINLSLVMFVGGGSILIKEELTKLFDKKYSYFHKNPLYANANGMLKIANSVVKNEK